MNDILTVRVSWSRLPRDAKAFRVAHAAWSAVALGGLATIWWSAAARRRSRVLGASIGFLLVEGGALVIGGGDCPMGAFQARLGDPVPFFELVLPPAAAKAAVPALAIASLIGIVAVFVRPPTSVIR